MSSEHKSPRVKQLLWCNQYHLQAALVAVQKCATYPTMPHRYLPGRETLCGKAPAESQQQYYNLS